MSKEPSEAPEEIQSIIDRIGDKTAHCCVELFHKAQREAGEDFPHYDVLQNVLARAATQALRACQKIKVTT